MYTSIHVLRVTWFRYFCPLESAVATRVRCTRYNSISHFYKNYKKYYSSYLVTFFLILFHIYIRVYSFFVYDTSTYLVRIQPTSWNSTIVSRLKRRREYFRFHMRFALDHLSLESGVIYRRVFDCFIRWERRGGGVLLRGTIVSRTEYC